ncbi:SH3 domain-containing protein [Panaeolus papilionaceus]|nr:SH3 domain-containing protein [Panaeolus papilionaceus]
MSPQDPQAAALLAHVLAQIENNVSFLAENNYISQSDASAILTKLPNSNDRVQDRSPISSLASRMSNMMPVARPTPPPPAPRAVPAPPAPAPAQVRALWAYNGQDAEELSFASGDIIELVEETNADWWTGRIHNQTGLFPSTYVEKLPQRHVAAGSTNKPAYKPFGAAYHGMNAPPPPGQGTNSVGLQEQPGQEEKKQGFGKYKATLAHSAVGGVGFGAGSAIGGGLVRAIF